MKRVIALILAVALCMGLYVFASSETVVSLSYLNNTIKPQVEKDIESQVKAMFKAPTNISEELFSQGGMISDVAKRVLERMQMKGYYMYSTTGREEVVLKKGDVLSGLSGTTFIMRDGSASVINDAIINLTKGEEIKAGAAIPQSTHAAPPAVRFPKRRTQHLLQHLPLRRILRPQFHLCQKSLHPFVILLLFIKTSPH